jgi:acyl-coenzyme A synthetase/AMP-(fatty) acid ligase
VQEKITLLPSTRTPEVLRQIKENYPQTFCLHDGGDPGTPGADVHPAAAAAIALYRFPGDPAPAAPDELPVPTIPATQVAAIVFTSGSTGLPLPHAKSWGSLVASAFAEHDALEMGTPNWSLIGTVPSQHMYGFETLILLALQGGAALWAGHPFYPADVFAAIDAMPRPRMLVTSPTHLRALLADGAHCPPVDRIVSATALLPRDLCDAAEAAFGTALYEIYGSTETGQLASRKSAATPLWTLFPGVRLDARDGVCWASGGHVAAPTPLSDILEINRDGRFTLHGRSTDMINIAGRRSSLAFLNHALLSVPGVVDACLFLPDSVPAGGAPAPLPDTGRLCAFVVAPGLDAAHILAHLREHMDPVFLPRPIIPVPALPRNETGKLPHQALMALFEQHRQAAWRRAT